LKDLFTLTLTRYCSGCGESFHVRTKVTKQEILMREEIVFENLQDAERRIDRAECVKCKVEEVTF